MDRLSKLLLAAIVASAPLPALAQSKAAVIAGAPQMAAKTPALIVVREDVRMPRHRIAIPNSTPTPQLRLSAYDAPRIDVPAKDAWFDDQGLQWKGSKVAFKRRF